MSKFLLSYHGGGMPSTPAEGERIMAAWNGWFEKLGKAVVDGGNPTATGKTIAANGSVSATAANPVSGYSILEAKDLDGAVALAKGCPILAGGGTIEVAELMPM